MGRLDELDLKLKLSRDPAPSVPSRPRHVRVAQFSAPNHIELGMQSRGFKPLR